MVWDDPSKLQGFVHAVALFIFYRYAPLSFSNFLFDDRCGRLFVMLDTNHLF